MRENWESEIGRDGVSRGHITYGAIDGKSHTHVKRVLVSLNRPVPQEYKQIPQQRDAHVTQVLPVLDTEQLELVGRLSRVPQPREGVVHCACVRVCVRGRARYRVPSVDGNVRRQIKIVNESGTVNETG